jgi:hypothetical protein
MVQGNICSESDAVPPETQTMVLYAAPPAGFARSACSHQNDSLVAVVLMYPQTNKQQQPPYRLYNRAHLLETAQLRGMRGRLLLMLSAKRPQGESEAARLTKRTNRERTTALGQLHYHLVA